MILFKYLEDKKSEIQSVITSHSSEQKMIVVNKERLQALSVEKQSVKNLKSQYLLCDLEQGKQIAQEILAKSEKWEKLRAFHVSVQEAFEIVRQKIGKAGNEFENTEEMQGLYAQKIALETRWFKVSQEMMALRESIVSRANEISLFTGLCSKLHCKPEQVTPEMLNDYIITHLDSKINELAASEMMIEEQIQTSIQQVSSFMVKLAEEAKILSAYYQKTAYCFEAMALAGMTAACILSCTLGGWALLSLAVATPICTALAYSGFQFFKESNILDSAAEFRLKIGSDMKPMAV